MGLFGRKKAKKEQAALAAPVPEVPALPTSLHYVSPDGGIRFRADTVDEAEDIIVELKLMRKQKLTERKIVKAEVNKVHAATWKQTGPTVQQTDQGQQLVNPDQETVTGAVMAWDYLVGQQLGTATEIDAQIANLEHAITAAEGFIVRSKNRKR